MSRIRCLLVDDEPPAIALLQKYAREIEQLEVVGTSHSAVKAFDLLRDRTVDLLFLDIQMPVLNGIDFIKTLRNPPAVIITTAYREYALDGYDLDIIDYLLKPIAFGRFLKAVDRYRDRRRQPVVVPPAENPLPSHIFCTINRQRQKILLDEILYVESLKDYVRVHTHQERLVIKGNLGSFLQQLPGQQFMRIHRSYAVSVAKVEAFTPSQVSVSGRSLPLGGSYRAAVLERLGREGYSVE
ncbi:MAG: LytTR family DNA-binding domain-containing protein [Bacteroidota bacterium]